MTKDNHMWRQIFTCVTLPAFVNFLMGCMVTSSQKVPGQGAPTISPKEKVTELVLLDGTTVAFDQRGGTFGSVPREVIQGRSLYGGTVFVPISEVWQCRTSPPASLSLADLDTAHIAEVILKDNSLVTFEAPGAAYDKKTGEITGAQFPRGNVSYQLDQLSSIRAQRPSVIRVVDLNRQPDQRVYEVVDKWYTVFTFDSTGGHIASVSSGFYGKSKDGDHVEVAADSVLYAAVERIDPVGTALATLGVIVAVIGVAALIVAATKQSCPFIYAFDGQQYVFDAEPLGGAICPGLGRTDISRLDYVKLVDGKYRLLVQNEVPETQYIDRMRLLLVDHPPETAAYPDLQGKFYTFKHVQEARSATDEKGMSLMKFLRASDKVAWQTHLASASREVDGPTRHELTLTLPKPLGAHRAWLITNIGTSLWGSNMIRKTTEYRGSSAETWLSSITPGSQSFIEMNQFLEREEMYHLKAWMKEGASWTQATTILGQGPLISEDRVYPLDVSEVIGDSLVLRFNPPKGFWTFDYIGVSYDEPSIMNPVRIGANFAEDQRGSSLLGSLSTVDSTYYAMPEVGDWARVNFSAAPPKEGLVRSVYLETSGYYKLHLSKDKPDQFARLYSIGMSPGQIVKTAMEEFRAWQAEQQMARQQSLPSAQ